MGSLGQYMMRKGLDGVLFSCLLTPFSVVCTCRFKQQDPRCHVFVLSIAGRSQSLTRLVTGWGGGPPYLAPLTMSVECLVAIAGASPDVTLPLL
jgi:hypothetical protein